MNILVRYTGGREMLLEIIKVKMLHIDRVDNNQKNNQNNFNYNHEV